MIRKIIFLLLTLTFSLIAKATLFQVVPLEKLIEDSHSAAEVVLKEKKSFMNQMGLIFTEYTFLMNESYNVENKEILSITMTGGTVNGVTSFIDGAPEFSVGEKSFLLLKKIEGKMYLSNFTMGKYRIEQQEGKTYYISSVFPSDPGLGRVPKERMIELVKEKFKIVKNTEDSSKIVEIKSSPSFVKDTKRIPAQENGNKSEGRDGRDVFWIFFGLLCSSGLVIWWKLRKGAKT